MRASARFLIGSALIFILGVLGSPRVSAKDAQNPAVIQILHSDHLALELLEDGLRLAQPRDWPSFLNDHASTGIRFDHFIVLFKPLNAPSFQVEGLPHLYLYPRSQKPGAEYQLFSLGALNMDSKSFFLAYQEKRFKRALRTHLAFGKSPLLSFPKVRNQVDSSLESQVLKVALSSQKSRLKPLLAQWLYFRQERLASLPPQKMNKQKAFENQALTLDGLAALYRWQSENMGAGPQHTVLKGLSFMTVYTSEFKRLGHLEQGLSGFEAVSQRYTDQGLALGLILERLDLSSWQKKVIQMGGVIPYLEKILSSTKRAWSDQEVVFAKEAIKKRFKRTGSPLALNDFKAAPGQLISFYIPHSHFDIQPDQLLYLGGGVHLLGPQTYFEWSSNQVRFQFRGQILLERSAKGFHVHFKADPVELQVLKKRLKPGINHLGATIIKNKRLYLDAEALKLHWVKSQWILYF